MEPRPDVLRGVPPRPGAVTLRLWTAIVFGSLVTAFAVIGLVGLLSETKDSDSLPAVLVTLVFLGIGLFYVLPSVARLRRLTGVDVRVDERGLTLSDGRTWAWSDVADVDLGTRHGHVVDRLRVRFAGGRRGRVVMLHSCSEEKARDLLERHRPRVTSGR